MLLKKFQILLLLVFVLAGSVGCVSSEERARIEEAQKRYDEQRLRAHQEAEARAERERQEAEARAERERQEAEARAERERQEAEARAERERQEAEARAERERQEAEARAERERKEAEARDPLHLLANIFQVKADAKSSISANVENFGKENNVELERFAEEFCRNFAKHLVKLRREALELKLRLERLRIQIEKYNRNPNENKTFLNRKAQFQDAVSRYYACLNFLKFVYERNKIGIFNVDQLFKIDDAYVKYF